jgi:hypothetical protein
MPGGIFSVLMINRVRATKFSERLAANKN